MVDTLNVGDAVKVRGRDYVIVGKCSGFWRLRDLETNKVKTCAYLWLFDNCSK